MGLLRLLGFLVHLYAALLLVRIILSWVAPYARHELVDVLRRVTDPYLNLFRRAFPFLVVNGIDFSPILAFLLLSVVGRVLA